MAKVVLNKFETATGPGIESIDSLMKRFKRKVMEEGILDEVRRREFFVNKSTKRREKSKRAKIRALKNKKNKY